MSGEALKEQRQKIRSAPWHTPFIAPHLWQRFPLFRYRKPLLLAVATSADLRAPANTGPFGEFTCPDRSRLHSIPALPRSAACPH
jgi:hypothetical protein